MSLIGFHRFLISTAILFSAIFAFRQLSGFKATGNIWTLIAAIVLGLAVVALGYYLAHLRDFLKMPSEPSQRPSTHELLHWPEARAENQAARPNNGKDKLERLAAPSAGPEASPKKDGHNE